MIRKLTKNFLYCGAVGWCVEILFTAFQSFRRRDWRLIGQTSLWMFPIYGLGCLLIFPYRLLKNRSRFIRGFSYMVAIFTGEYVSGRLLNRFHACPWDYSRCRFNLHRVIRLDYAPGWFMLGLFLEKIHSR
ncbi:MAG: putative ABC transporter permease [Lachnospiraceae bacterium]|nr:putative ABC transporter permease [Lachnospiraceae bacterium]MDD7026737.1 hypothetical protein [Lachnospiraceae bacterium]MDY5699477.1 hypothetical protein [Lachnospiraceae bacterium]